MQRDAKELAKAYIQALDQHDFDKLCQVTTSTYSFKANDLELPLGDLEKHREVWMNWWKKAPDVRSKPLKIIHENDELALLMEVSGNEVVTTHGTIHQAWSMVVAIFCKISDGKISQWHEFFDPTPFQKIINSNNI